MTLIGCVKRESRVNVPKSKAMMEFERARENY